MLGTWYALSNFFVDELMNIYNLLPFLSKDLFNNGENGLNLLDQGGNKF